MAALTGSGKGIQIVVGANYKDTDLKRAQRDLDALKAKAAATASPMQKLGSTIKGMVGPALIGAAAAAGAFAVKMAVDGVQAAADEDKQLAILKQTLDNVGQGFAMDEVNQFVDNLRFATGVADDELRPAFEKLVGATHDAASAQQLLKVAVDTSVGSGKDLSAVSMAMAKAVAGSSTALKRLVPELDATALAGGGADKVMAVLQARFGGSASAAAKTFAGQLQRLQDGFNELTESFGHGFLDQLTGATDTADSLATALRNLQPAAEQVGASLGNIFKTIADNRDLINYFAISVGAQMKMVSTAIDGIGYAWKGVVGFVTGSWPSDETAAAAKSASQMAYEFGNSSKGAAILADMISTNTTPATASLGDAAVTSTDEMSLLREQIRLTTRSLGPLTAAFDEANAAMDRRQAMQDYRDALKAFIQDPSAQTRDATVAAMISMAESFDNPKQAIKFVGQAMGDLTAAAKDAGIKIPPDVANIQSAFETAKDPIARVKQLMEDIPTRIQTQIAMNVTVNGKYYDPYGAYDSSTKKPATGGPFATGGYVRAALGTHASDNIPAMLSRGEYVLNADTVRRLGVGTLNGLNNGGSMGGSGVMIQTLNVQSVAGERAEESVPRALRRLAFVAGLNG